MSKKKKKEKKWEERTINAIFFLRGININLSSFFFFFVRYHVSYIFIYDPLTASFEQNPAFNFYLFYLFGINERYI